jgi:hypothetical protein
MDGISMSIDNYNESGMDFSMPAADLDGALIIF